MIVLGDQREYVTGQVQKVKLAAMEAEWETHAPPSSFTIVGIPDQAAQRTRAKVSIPWLGGIIVTRSLDQPVKGIKDLIEESRGRIESGIKAYVLLEKIRSGDRSDEIVAQFNAHKNDLGYGLLLKRYTDNVAGAIDAQIDRAARGTIPNVGLMFWSFRIMVGLGFWMLGLMAISFYYCARRLFHKKRWLLKLLVINLPVPWIAAELGWFVSEYGRQPWTIGEVLPTFMSSSTLEMGDIVGSIIGLTVIYTVLLAIEVFLMAKFIRIGPSSLHTGRYHFEEARESAV